MLVQMNPTQAYFISPLYEKVEANDRARHKPFLKVLNFEIKCFKNFYLMSNTVRTQVHILNARRISVVFVSMRLLQHM